LSQRDQPTVVKPKSEPVKYTELKQFSHSTVHLWNTLYNPQFESRNTHSVMSSPNCLIYCTAHFTHFPGLLIYVQPVQLHFYTPVHFTEVLANHQVSSLSCLTSGHSACHLACLVHTAIGRGWQSCCSRIITCIVGNTIWIIHTSICICASSKN